MGVIYEKLKAMREKAGLRQGQIAGYLGLTESFISEVESGERNLSVDQLESVADLYGCSLAVFADAEEEPLPIQSAFGSHDVSPEDLRVVAAIGRIAANSKFMAKILEGSYVG